MILKKIKEKDESFSLIKYLGGDEEKYFEVLQQWKTEISTSAFCANSPYKVFNEKKKTVFKINF